MSTLLEAAKTLIKVLELEKSQIVLSMTSGRALEQLEQAIAQEQANKNTVPIELVRFGGRCNIHPLNILPCAACREQSKSPKTDSGTSVRNCLNCKHVREPACSETCTNCKHAYTSNDNWEPKP